MNTLRIFTVIVAICIAQVLPALAEKKLTTYQRQVNLMKRVNEAQKTKQITAKQAKSLRKDLSKIAVKKQKVRDGRVEDKAADTAKIEERLTKTSKKINTVKQENKKDAQ